MLRVLLFFIISFNAFGYSSCEINFVKYVNGELPADVAKNPMINMWDENFDPEFILKKLRDMQPAERKQFLTEMRKLVHRDQTFNQNLSIVLSRVNEEKLIPYGYLRRNFIEHEFENARFFFLQGRKEFSASLDIDPLKTELIEGFIKKSKLDDYYAKEYATILTKSNLSIDDLDFAIANGLTLRQTPKELDQFAKYIDFLDNVKPHKIRKGLKHIDDIYVYEVARSMRPGLPPHQKFLQQNRKLANFEERRIREIERGLKLQQKNGTVAEIDEAIQKEANGIRMRIQEKLRFRKKIDDEALPQALKQRARMQAKHERGILRRIWNGCNKGSSQRIAGAKKKFSRFKFALALGANPAFYAYKNWDKREEDPFFWEKMGYEVAMGVFFTFVGNKLITNTNTSFWRKYFEGYLKFSVLSGVDSFGYEALFGNKSYVRYLQRIYKGDIPESQLEEEYRALVESPNFEENVKELVDYLEEQSEKHNTKNFLDKYLNLSASASVDDELRITKEDLESEEGREMLMELVAERIYLQNMGEWPFFQTGRKDLDRFAFYRARSVLWDVKGLLVNLAVFELMCREPFGRIGSWGAILALVIGDRYLDGSLSYGLRREAINQ